MKAPARAPVTRRLDEMYRFERSGMRPGLAGIERLLTLAGRPDRGIPSVLIAGTNGKGSTAAHLHSILSAAGLKTGLYTSPHLVRFNERIRVSGREIPDEALGELLERWWPRFEAARPSFFEATTALCFDHFAASRLDLAVVEVGIGGRLDATNILDPAVSVITTISSDHEEILGHTLGRIASEKAGVARPGGILVCGVRGRDARAAIARTAWERGARVEWLGTSARYRTRGLSLQGTELSLKTSSFSGTLRTPLLGAHQARNAALAALAAEAVLAGRGAAFIASAIAEGITKTRWPARAELISADPPVLVDVAHNAEGAAALAATVAALFPGRRVAFVVALSRDKAHREFLRRLGAAASRFYLTQFEGERSTPASSLLDAAPSRHLTCEAVPSIHEALDRALAWAKGSDGIVVVAGSFFLIAEALPHLGVRVPDAI
ncbi:MAG: bifunctional folylpolyglutamate synthase/dihydrofolate synthase [Candidatus Latescibacteria bacterium]|nr:bifunctional folylpolyglutamate synthase/dihydrofolate synthase [Candidatus Latescibacterota bacterium]